MPFLHSHSGFPDHYYHFPKNIHITAFGGIKLRHQFSDNISLLRGVELYGQAGTIDAYIWYRFISDKIRLNQIFSVALRVNFLLGE